MMTCQSFNMNLKSKQQVNPVSNTVLHVDTPVSSTIRTVLLIQ